MPPELITCDQNSAEWFEARRGRITASRIVDVISYNDPSSARAKELGFKLVREAVAAGIKGESSAKRLNYLKELRGERITGKTTQKHYVSPYMDHGTEYEHIARIAYKAAFDIAVTKVGFAVHPTLEYSGASVDALAGDKGILEIKCPQIETHLDYREAGVVPEEYETQCMWGMEVCEREWCDFVSFHPDAPEDLRIFVVRRDYDAERAKFLREEVVKFNAEIEASIDRLYGGKRPTLNQQLRKSVAMAEVDPDSYITDADLPQWARDMHAQHNPDAPKEE